MGVDHLGGSDGLRQEIQKLWRELRRVAKATLNNASVGGGGIRVYDAGAIRFEEGGGIVIAGSGYIIIDGDLTGAGDLSWTGPWDLAGLGTVTGDVTFTGQMTVNGPWKFVGNGQITGDVDVTGNIKVLPGGKIQVGNIVIDPTISGGAVTFANGAQVFTDASTIQVFKGGSVVQISDDYARLQSPHGVISTSSDGVRLTGYGTVNVADVPGAFVGAAILDSSGYLKKVVS